MSQIIDLDITDSPTVERLSAITFEAFQENAPEWLPTLEQARKQVIGADSAGRLGRVFLIDGQPAGWIGVIKRRHLWEIHPIAVALEHQYNGCGHRLVEDVAAIAKRAGVLTLLAGTSDEVGTTNLFAADLYADPATSIRNIHAIGRSPYRFWENAGFTVVGLIPDAEGRGKPAIQLARRLH
jgi:aminoglycoside 6'-N-acetyltransferase I